MHTMTITGVIRRDVMLHEDWTDHGIDIKEVWLMKAYFIDSQILIITGIKI